MARICFILSLLTFSHYSHAQLSTTSGGFGDFVRLCNLDTSPFKSLVRHDVSGAFFVVENDNSQNRTRSRLVPETQEPVPAMVVESTSRNFFQRALGGRNNINKNYTLIAKVRECTCSLILPQAAYCPSEKDMCGLSPDGSISCFTRSQPSTILQNCWPIVMMWYIVVLLFLFFTEQGRNSRRYVRACFCNSRLNNELVDGMLDGHRRYQRRPPIRAGRRSLSRDGFHQSDVPALDDPPSDDDEARRPQRLTLKTKRFCRPCGISDDEDEAYNCSICFVALQEGDRVGALPCQHSFHVDCLKLWIRRKNVCPLCQIPNVATRIQNDDIAQPYTSERQGQSRSNLEVTRDLNEGRNPGGPFAGRVILTRIRR